MSKKEEKQIKLPTLASLLNMEDRAYKRMTKQHKKAIAKFRKLAGVPKGATQEEAKKIILEYVPKMDKKDVWQVALSDEQRKDPQFVKDLFRANPALINWIIVWDLDRDKNLLEDKDFVFDYITMRIDYTNQNMFAGKDETRATIEILRGYKQLLKDTEFVQKLADKYPQSNMLFVLNELCPTNFPIAFDKEENERNSEIVKTDILALSDETLLRHAKKFGAQGLVYIPKEHPCYSQAVKLACQKDGFSALALVDATKLTQFRDTIVETAKLHGAEALHKFVEETLSPRRKHCYMCHGKPHLFYEDDANYEKVQNELRADAEIGQILELYAQWQAQKEFLVSSACLEDNCDQTEKQ